MVRRKPRNRIKLLFSQPACSLGFFQHQLAGNHFAPETVHRKMEGGIIVFNGVDEVAYRDLGIQLFPDLSFQCLLRGFTRLDFAARKLP